MIRLLIADDHPVVRAGLASLIGPASDIRVVGEAQDFPSTHRALAEREVDVLILDVDMPGGAVLSALEQIGAAHGRVRVLVLSMHAEDELAVRTLQAGAAGYVRKDRATDELMEAIREVAAGRRYIGRELAEQLLQQVETGGQPAHRRLSRREYQVFMRLVQGERPTDIATALHLSVKTISTHKTRLMAKMGARSVAQLTRYALEHELI